MFNAVSLADCRIFRPSICDTLAHSPLITRPSSRKRLLTLPRSQHTRQGQRHPNLKRHHLQRPAHTATHRCTGDEHHTTKSTTSRQTTPSPASPQGQIHRFPTQNPHPPARPLARSPASHPPCRKRVHSRFRPRQRFRQTHSFTTEPHPRHLHVYLRLRLDLRSNSTQHTCTPVA